MNIKQAPKFSASDICDSSITPRSSLRAYNGSNKAHGRTSMISMREGKWPKLYTEDEISKWFLSVNVRLEFYPYGEEPEIRVRIFPFNKMELIGDLSIDEFFDMAPECS